MKSDRSRSSELMGKATCSENLTERAESNRLYAKNNFNLWINTLLDNLKFSSVLDVCCGTGNQLVLYGARAGVSLIVGVDISKQALGVAKERLQKMKTKGRIVLEAVKMEDMFSVPEIEEEQFDLISCFYGLYYSHNIKKTLNEMIHHLPNNGTLLIVGPYGKNNANFFDLLQRYFTLPDLVVRSSTTFMEHEVYPILANHCEVKKETFSNHICYPDAKSLIDYWRASTFYFSEYEDAVARDIEAHFSVHGEFVVEKHVMAYIARKVL